MNAYSRIRSLLFVPGNSQSKMATACRIRADVLILDWEDAVLPADKASARRKTVEFLRQRSEGPLGFVRFNPAGTPAFEEDVKSLAEFIPAGIVLSKCQSAADVRQLAHALDRMDATSQCAICPLVESPKGLMDAMAIAAASPRVGSLAFGAEDFSAEMEIRRTEGEPELLYARSALVTACRAAGREAIDSPCLEFRDLARLETSAQRARNLGFSAKLAIHPDQIEAINRAFTPAPEEVARARVILDAFSSAGTGVITVEGHMVDEAVLKRARRILMAAGVDL